MRRDDPGSRTRSAGFLMEMLPSDGVRSPLGIGQEGDALGRGRHAHLPAALRTAATYLGAAAHLRIIAKVLTILGAACAYLRA
jgi:hypothetical protein